MSTKLDDLIRGYLDGELNEVDRRTLLEMLRGDPVARKEADAMEALHSLLEDLHDEAPEPPEDLGEAVMERVASRAPPARPLWRRLADGLTGSPLRLATASCALVAAGLLIGLGVARIAMWQAGDVALDTGGPEDIEAVVAGAHDREPREIASMGEEDGHVRVHFILRAPEAGRVAVVGDFNGWDSRANPLERAGDVWRAVIPLPRGRYEYQFVVDGEIWLVDPAAQGTVDDGFGGTNGVLEV